MEPAGVSRFWLFSAAKMSWGETPKVASRSWEKDTKMRSACSPMMLTFFTPATCNRR
ncbi:hypothetical protein D3C78_1809950 [compost metagenome]